MTSFLPPLVFEPRLVPKIWGGRRLQTVLGKPLPSVPPDVPFGESWEIYDFPPGVVATTSVTPPKNGGADQASWVSSVVANPGELAGMTLHDLVLEHPAALLGNAPLLHTAAGPQFPLLIKFLDAREDLSIQVHPTPAYAQAHPDAHLKTECWVILDHDRGARLYKGLKPGVTRDSFADSLRSGTVTNLILTHPARTGDCHFLPSGTLHALGAGILVAEVQTPSDTTFRVWDFNRLENGKPRALHLEQALACLDFSPDAPPVPLVTSTRRPGVPLVKCPYFTTVAMPVAAHAVKPLVSGQMKVWILAEGGVKLRWTGGQLSAKRGQTVLLPASLPPGTLATFPGNALILQTTVAEAA